MESVKEQVLGLVLSLEQAMPKSAHESRLVKSRCRRLVTSEGRPGKFIMPSVRLSLLRHFQPSSEALIDSTRYLSTYRKLIPTSSSACSCSGDNEGVFTSHAALPSDKTTSIPPWAHIHTYTCSERPANAMASCPSGNLVWSSYFGSLQSNHVKLLAEPVILPRFE